MKHRLLMLIAILALMVPLASPAAANGPTRAEFPIPPGGIDLPDGVCAFPVHIDALKDQAKVITFYNSQGQPRFSLTNGSLKLRVTNTSNQRWVEVNVSGPGRFTADFSQLTTQGNWLIFLANTNVTGAPSRLFLVSGQSVMDLDANTNATSFRLLGGQTTNVCGLIN
jgi:hypothetical protein